VTATRARRARVHFEEMKVDTLAGLDELSDVLPQRYREGVYEVRVALRRLNRYLSSGFVEAARRTGAHSDLRQALDRVLTQCRFEIGNSHNALSIVPRLPDKTDADPRAWIDILFDYLCGDLAAYTTSALSVLMSTLSALDTVLNKPLTSSDEHYEHLESSSFVLCLHNIRIANATINSLELAWERKDTTRRMIRSLLRDYWDLWATAPLNTQTTNDHR
jgi:hypothetical protein